jgi:hypothetical protein
MSDLLLENVPFKRTSRGRISAFDAVVPARGQRVFRARRALRPDRHIVC